MLGRAFGLVCLLSVATWADDKTAAEWFAEGEDAYNLGNFDAAVEAFKAGFSVETVAAKKPAYIYNIAQAYRGAGKCKDAAFFYRRFLSLKANDTAKPLSDETRAEIEQRIAEQDQCAKQIDALRAKPPTNVLPADTSSPAPTKQVATPSEDSDETEEEAEPAHHRAAWVSARLLGGVSKLYVPGVDVPLRATGTLIAGYPIPIADELRVEAGAAVAFTSVAYDDGTHSASLTTLLANATLAYTVRPALEVRGDLGAGVLLFGGLERMGNPFAIGGAPASGTLVMPVVRVGASVAYTVTANLDIVVAPIAFSYSPAKDGLAFTALSRLDILAGVGGRM
jgi:hypothetical protein